jgi:alpha-D-xyloside xylohydrolase
MLFDFPGDPRFADSWEQYMYGPDLLVAPVWRSGAREKRVLLPEGTWNSYWDPSQSWEGPADITVPAPLDRLPLFIRDGASVSR